MEALIYIGLFAPLLGFLTLMAFSNALSRRIANGIGCVSVFCSFICFSTLIIEYAYHIIPVENFILYSWLKVPGIQADFALHLDSLSLLMTIIITGVGFLIHLYSIGYTDHEHDYVRYFACMNFFVFAMLLLVLAENLLLLFVGWEGVGLASYLLIGYWYTLPKAAQAAKKAFVVNRIGDLGLLLGLLLTFQLFGTSDMSQIPQIASQHFAVGAPILTVLTLLYFVGAIGKSAQIPLHVWLPDAMAGPTPVSALIHAATMVTAGVYLVVRLHALFMMAPVTLYVIGIIGAVTSLFAAICALGQTDLKRVLAYSTVSQLGLMFLACSVGAFYTAMFHLTTHAFIKALLFLSAGNVVHMMHGNTEMDKMGGLSKIFTKTHWLFLIGVLALSGIPPLSAFFSKELILEEEHVYGPQILFYVALAASILTGFYLTRAYCLAFLGKPSLEKSILQSIKEAPVVMLAPLGILAFFSIVGGSLGVMLGKEPLLESLLTPLGLNAEEKEFSEGMIWTSSTLLGTLGAIAGVLTAGVIYTRFADSLGKPLKWLRDAFYVDELYDSIVVSPVQWLSKGIVHFFEPKVFDGSMRLATYSTQGVAEWLQQFQSGQIRSYVAWMVVGTVLIVAYFVF